MIFERTVLEKFVISAYNVWLSRGKDKVRPDGVVYNLIVNMLDAYYNKGKKYIFLNAPTGYGKTIIGFLLHYSMIEAEKELGNSSPKSYYLTSAKMLQEQIEKDSIRFDLPELAILKGVANYECNLSVKEYNEAVKTHKNTSKEIIFYDKRPCKAVKSDNIPLEYSECWHVCNYKCKRDDASFAPCAVVNYHYFLNVMRGEFNPYFGPRDLTICDEAHLIPNVVCDFFNGEFNDFLIKSIYKKLNDVYTFLYGSKKMSEENLFNVAMKIITSLFNVFEYPATSLNPIMFYLTQLELLKTEIDKIAKIIAKQPELEAQVHELEHAIERIDDVLTKREHFDKLEKRPEDLHITSEQEFKSGKYKHIVRDLSEADLVKSNFLSKTKYCLFMSATLGKFHNYATLMGIDESEYAEWDLPITFDFSSSPIYEVYSGSLITSRGNFDSNIDKCIMDTLKICNELHLNEKGIIHTGSFKVSQKLKDAIYNGIAINPKRFLFYNNSAEKEEQIELLKHSTIPYIIVGPSLNEGLDLKDDLGRFNILIKVPFSTRDKYAERKSERYPFWYSSKTLEVVIQCIGRTNRHVNDYSSTYLIDSYFKRFINDNITHIPSAIFNRIEKFSFEKAKHKLK